MPARIVAAAIGAAVAAAVVGLLGRIPERALRGTNLLVFHPDRYHGENRDHHFFEGWYYKLVRPGSGGPEHHGGEGGPSPSLPPLSMGVVPGIFFGNESGSPESHAFVFVTVNGERQHYFRFGVDEFRYTRPGEGEYSIEVGGNRFTHSGLSLDLFPRGGDDADLTLSGNVTFADPSPWPVSFFGLGAMGPAGWMPLLECSHGVLSFDHILGGSLFLNGTEEPLDGGRGYTEKDHGRAFPRLWIWLQTNSFPRHPGTSLFLSVARVPFLGWDFPGFTAAVWHGGEVIPFATYNGASFDELRVDDDELRISLRGGRHRLELTVDRRVPSVTVYGPVNSTRMEPSIDEALNARVRMRLSRDGELLVDDVGEHAGLEVHQNVGYLVDNVCGKPTANRLFCL